MNKQHLDLILVPSGLLLLLAYHVWLIYHVVKHPTRTVLGINAINRRIWVQTMMEDPAKTGVLAVQTLRNNIMASTLLATMAIMLSSLVAVVMTNAGGQTTIQEQGFVYGNTTQLGLSVKFFAILACFLLAFLFDLQSIRYYSHASILINVPIRSRNQITPDYVARTLNRGGYFWSLGLRAFYFSFPLFFWIFGPVPMFVCCVALLCMLYFLDVSFVIEMGGEEEGRKEDDDGGTAVVLVSGY